MIVGITGGTGFVGRALVRRHLAAGDTVKVLSPASEVLPAAVRLFRGDLTGPADSLIPFANGVDVLYHCAAEIRDEARMHEVHVTGTANLCAAACGRIGHWVQLSSVGVYGRRPNGVVTEDIQLSPSSVYERTKGESDRIVVDNCGKGAFTYSILRPSNVFGPTMTNRSLFQMIACVNKGVFFFIGNPGASANYIHVDNVVEGLLRCAQTTAAKGKIYNLSDHRTIEVFVAVVADELDRPGPELRLPEMPVRCLAKLCGWLPRFPLTTSRVNALTNRSVYSIDKIQKELGYTHRISMEDALRQMVEAWKKAS